MPDSREQLDHQSTGPKSSEKQQTGPKLSGADSVKKGAESVLGASEGSDSAEDGAEAMGNVSESNSEDKKTGSQGSSGSQGMTNDQKEEKRAKLLANPPDQSKMIQQIKDALSKEEHALEKKFGNLVSNPQKDPAEFVEVVSKMRQIRVYLDSMLNATYEYVKHLWLKIVHGV